jgi:restriction system protein
MKAIVAAPRVDSRAVTITEKPTVKLRMAENSLFAILLRQRWWVSASIAVAIGLVATALLPAEWRVAGALSGFPFIVIAVMAAWRGRHTPSDSRIAQVDAALRSMPWPAFANLLEQAFRRDGHEVRRTNGSGADFELVRKGQTLLVSARRWKSARTGLEPLRELQAAREKAGAAALYIGLGEISEPAAAFAAQHRIAFWRAGELAESLRGVALPPAKADNPAP